MWHGHPTPSARNRTPRETLSILRKHTQGKRQNRSREPGLSSRTAARLLASVLWHTVTNNTTAETHIL